MMASSFEAQALATALAAEGVTDRPGHFGVGGRRTARDQAERVPDSALERRPLDVERQVDADARPVDQLHDVTEALGELGGRCSPARPSGTARRAGL